MEEFHAESKVRKICYMNKFTNKRVKGGKDAVEQSVVCREHTNPRARPGDPNGERVPPYKSAFVPGPIEWMGGVGVGGGAGPEREREEEEVGGGGICCFTLL